MFKMLNGAQLLASFYLARIIKNIQPWGVPMTISVEPTTACNLRCPECPSGLRSFSRPTGTLSQDLYFKVLDQTYRRLIYLIFYFQGEPYIHPSFLDMVKEAHKKNVYTITSTNGHFLNETNARATVLSGLDRLIISIDGATQEVYEQYRKEGNLENALQGARNVVKWKKKLASNSPHIIFQMLVVKPNEHQINEVNQLAREIGVNEVKLKSAQLYDYEHGHDLMPKDSQFSRYELNTDGTYGLKKQNRNECWRLWHAAVMTWDGQILPCCFDKDAQHSMGNINEFPISHIWESPTYVEFRKKIRKGRDQIDICQNCSEGCRVWV